MDGVEHGDEVAVDDVGPGIGVVVNEEGAARPAGQGGDEDVQTPRRLDGAVDDHLGLGARGGTGVDGGDGEAGPFDVPLDGLEHGLVLV